MSGDPRFYLAAQRTLLAWLRTGIAVMAFGFVVARLGLVLSILESPGRAAPEDPGALFIGLALVALGVLATGTGAIQYERFCQSLPDDQRPESALRIATSVIPWALAVVGVLLGAVLLAP